MTNAAQAGKDLVTIILIGIAIYLYARLVLWAARKTAEASYRAERDAEMLSVEEGYEEWEQERQRKAFIKRHPPNHPGWDALMSEVGKELQRPKLVKIDDEFEDIPFALDDPTRPAA